MANLPFHFNGRDFSARNNMYLQKLMEFHEIQRLLYITSLRNQKSLDLNLKLINSKRHCVCPTFMKCYHFIVHNPSLLTAEFATKIVSNSLKSKKQTDLFINSRPIGVGNTSYTDLKALHHKDMKEPLISKIILFCHVDTTQKKAMKICDKVRNYVTHYLSTQSKQELVKLKQLKNELRMNMNQMSDLLKDGKCLFECKLQVQHNDIDLNYHVNQAVYGKFIENALCEYSKEYYDGKYLIAGLTINYIKEIRMNGFGNGLPYCVVKIYNDIVDKETGKKEIVGTVEAGDILYTQFKIILIVDDGNRIKQIRSIL